MITIKDIRVGAWCGLLNPYDDKAHIIEMKENGIDFTFEDIDDSPKEQQILHFCEEYGIDLFIRAGVAEGEEDRNRFLEIAKKNGYLDSKAFIGHSLADEPTARSYEDLAKRVKECKAAFPDKTPYINLLPAYAPLEVYGTPTYRDYIKEYAKVVGTDYISVDIYPFNEIEGVKGTYNDYLENISAVASVCRENDLEFYGFIQTMGFNHIMREPTELEMRWQCYCYLSFGCSRIMHFCYMTPPSGVEYFERAMIGKDGEKTPLWYYGKSVNDELHALSPLLCGYRNLGAFVVYGGEHSDGIEFADPISPDMLKTVSCLSADENTLIGVYEKDGKYAFTALNVSELRRSVDSHLTFTADGKITVFREGKTTELEEGENTLTLGAAVIFIN